MKIKMLIAALALASVSTLTQAQDFTKGVVKKLDPKSGKVTVIHEELKNLNMPAMTMVFRTKDKSMLDGLKAGSKIEFVAERVKGKLTLTDIK